MPAPSGAAQHPLDLQNSPQATLWLSEAASKVWGNEIGARLALRGGCGVTTGRRRVEGAARTARCTRRRGRTAPPHCALCPPGARGARGLCVLLLAGGRRAGAVERAADGGRLLGGRVPGARAARERWDGGVRLDFARRRARAARGWLGGGGEMCNVLDACKAISPAAGGGAFAAHGAHANKQATPPPPRCHTLPPLDQGRHVDRTFTVCYLPVCLLLIGAFIRFPRAPGEGARVLAGFAGFFLAMLAVPLVRPGGGARLLQGSWGWGRGTRSSSSRAAHLATPTHCVPCVAPAPPLPPPCPAAGRGLRRGRRRRGGPRGGVRCPAGAGGGRGRV
jgi:hypothetical protein